MALVKTSSESRERIEQYLEVMVIIAALATIPLTYYQAKGLDGPNHRHR